MTIKSMSGFIDESHKEYGWKLNKDDYRGFSSKYQKKGTDYVIEEEDVDDADAESKGSRKHKKKIYKFLSKKKV